MMRATGSYVAWRFWWRRHADPDNGGGSCNDVLFSGDGDDASLARWRFERIIWSVVVLPVVMRLCLHLQGGCVFGSLTARRLILICRMRATPERVDGTFGHFVWSNITIRRRMKIISPVQNTGFGVWIYRRVAVSSSFGNSMMTRTSACTGPHAGIEGDCS